MNIAGILRDWLRLWERDWLNVTARDKKKKDEKNRQSIKKEKKNKGQAKAKNKVMVMWDPIPVGRLYMQTIESDGRRWEQMGVDERRWK